MSVRIGSGADGRVPRRGLGVGVVEVAVCEPRPVIQKQIETIALELGAIAIQVVAAELVNDDNDNQLGLADVRLCLERLDGSKYGGKEEK